MSKQDISNEESIFINDLIEQTRKKDKALTRYIDKNLFPKRSQLSIEHINKNIETLKKMDSTQLAIVKARAKEFEEGNDPSKYFPTLLAVYGMIITLYGLLNKYNFIGTILYIFVLIFLIFFIYRNFIQVVRTRSTALYFNALIQNIRCEEKHTNKFNSSD